MICEHCGAEKPIRFDRAGLTYIGTPPGLFWKGRQLRLTRSQLLIVEQLVRRGRVGHAFLEMVVAPNALSASNSVKVQVHRIKQAFELAGIPYKIVSEFGIGYRLCVPSDFSTKLPPSRPAEKGMVPSWADYWD